MAVARFREILAPCDSQPSDPAELNQSAQWPQPQELWLPGLSSLGLIQGSRLTSDATATTPATAQGAGLNVSSGSRKYDTSYHDGKSCHAWVVVAYRNNAAPGAYQNLLRKNGTLTHVQEESNGNLRAAFWEQSSVVDVPSYGAASSCMGRVNVFAGRLTPGRSAIFLNGGAPITAGITGLYPLLSGAVPLCIGGNESSAEPATAWTILQCAIWYGSNATDVPSEAAIYELQRNPWQLLQRRIQVPVYAAGGGVALVGSAFAQAVGAGTLTTQAALAGAGSTTAAGQATLSAGSAGAVLTSSAAASMFGSATLTVAAALAGSGAEANAGTGALTVQSVLSGSGVASATGSASLTTGTSGAVLISAASASAGGSASLTTRAALTGAGSMQASASASLTLGASGAMLASVAIATAQASATLTVRAALATIAAARFGGSASLGGGLTASTPGFVASASGRRWAASGALRVTTAEWGDR